MKINYNSSPVTGTADTLVVGSVIAGASLVVNSVARRKVFGLGALVTVDAETDTFTFTAKWQVSNNGSTWIDAAGAPNNPANVVLATGTAGADASVSKVIPAPDCVYGARFARLALVTGGATGAAVDTYAIGYNYTDEGFVQ